MSLVFKKRSNIPHFVCISATNRSQSLLNSRDQCTRNKEQKVREQENIINFYKYLDNWNVY